MRVAILVDFQVVTTRGTLYILLELPSTVALTRHGFHNGGRFPGPCTPGRTLDSSYWGVFPSPVQVGVPLTGTTSRVIGCSQRGNNPGLGQPNGERSIFEKSAIWLAVSPAVHVWAAPCPPPSLNSVSVLLRCVGQAQVRRLRTSVYGPA